MQHKLSDAVRVYPPLLQSEEICYVHQRGLQFTFIKFGADIKKRNTDNHRTLGTVYKVQQSRVCYR